MKNRIYIKDLSNQIGQEVMIQGWVNACRNQGKMIFLDFRDVSGLVQGVILPGSEALSLGQTLKEEFVVEARGKINLRPEKDRKPEILNGEVELEVLAIKILNETEVLPFPINANTMAVNEALRLKYRYLDLRSDRLQKNVKNRFKVQSFVRDYLSRENFLEIETPLMSAPTPEGSRSFAVPSRLWPENFFSLPQSPQQYKQLLMVAGFEKYFQIARCFRDEDARGDRQPEFTQVDIEMSFTSEEEVMALNEKMLIELITRLYPEKKIQQVPFPRMSYREVMEKYGSDKPDLRTKASDPNQLAFLWVLDFPMFEKAEADNVDDLNLWTYTHNPFSSPQAGYYEQFKKKENIAGIISTQYDLVLNGFELGGGSLRNHRADDLQTTFEIMGYTRDRIENDFGHMLQALKFGAPPHGGIAWGLDRLLMILEDEPSIREVIAFSKTSDGKDLTMDAPNQISQRQLKELKIKFEK